MNENMSENTRTLGFFTSARMGILKEYIYMGY